MFPTLRRSSVRSIWDDPMEMTRDLDRMLTRLWGDGNAATEGLGHYPVDVHEDDGHIYVEAELPGFKKEEINVTLEGGVLTIAAERKVEETKGVRHLSERRFTRVQRSFTLPTTVDPSKVEATFTDGVLKLTLDKQETVKPRRIEVK
jgi:HSP20 family protein